MTHSTEPLDFAVPAARPRPTSVRWAILALLLAFSFMSWLNRVSMSVAYDERIRDELHLSATAIGYVYSALLFAYMLCMTPGGWFVDRWGSRWALAIMGLGSALFVALTGAVGFAALSVAATVGALLVVRAALGVFTAPIYPASGHAIAHWLPVPQRAAANGAVMGAALIGIASSYYAFGTLIDLFNWPGAFLVTGSVTALLALLWTCFARDFPAAHPAVNPEELNIICGGPAVRMHVAAEDAVVVTATAAAPRDGAGLWRTLAANRSLALLTVSYAAVGYVEYLFYFWVHHYFDQVLKVGPDMSRLYSTLVFLAMAAGMFLGGWVSDQLTRTAGRRTGRVAVVAGGMVLGALLVGLGLFSPLPGWTVLLFGLALAAVGATEGPSWATAVELGGRRGATAAGIFNTGGNAGGVLAPVITPLVSDAWGWKWGLGLGALICLTGACLWFWIDPDDADTAPPAS